MTRRALVLGTAAGVAAALHLHRADRAARRLTGQSPTLPTDDGVRLHVEVDGPTDAPLTVVFVHGFAARSAMYDPQWTALRGRARLVRFDLRGHGRSGWAGALRVTAPRLGRDLGQVVDGVAGPGPVVLVGHSMGGMAVLALAHARPELFGTRVVGVALLSTLAAPLGTAGQGTTGPVRRLREAAVRVGAWSLWAAAPLVHPLHPFRLRSVQRVLRRRLFAADPPEEAVRQVTASWVRTPTTVMSALLIGLGRFDQRAAAQALRGVPVLVLAGAEDATIPPSAAERAAERIGPDARLVVVPGAGHMVTLTHADAVHRELLDLLARTGLGTDERRASWSTGWPASVSGSACSSSCCSPTGSWSSRG